ncbi:uncharacterized protein SPPG_06863 [Spizellomyces punctatus DAOM BR117]|uniref:Uncharacterized protein n=1 Tax=Spizellomyces punctatus (strain DAOM BR117) TaxID=645134 RepID=A0A0L0H8K7_SPIPD|nr:uncharacterized protein SPPG_06863 [Spizellomyces punctatus DAOM BR117]KNC97870.1 hypothetical protein SPPG_06863 [Spizellomyces punctatus DAOM BR117]|eukprot:XP_016605910.1 hypothetical protein SPPG_06863 [Spizellomyces punctatus DAOM BR117]
MALLRATLRSLFLLVVLFSASLVGVVGQRATVVVPSATVPILQPRPPTSAPSADPPRLPPAPPSSEVEDPVPSATPVVVAPRPPVPSVVRPPPAISSNRELPAPSPAPIQSAPSSRLPVPTLPRTLPTPTATATSTPTDGVQDDQTVTRGSGGMPKALKSTLIIGGSMVGFVALCGLSVLGYHKVIKKESDDDDLPLTKRLTGTFNRVFHNSPNNHPDNGMGPYGKLGDTKSQPPPPLYAAYPTVGRKAGPGYIEEDVKPPYATYQPEYGISQPPPSSQAYSQPYGYEGGWQPATTIAYAPTNARYPPPPAQPRYGAPPTQARYPSPPNGFGPQ